MTVKILTKAELCSDMVKIVVESGGCEPEPGTFAHIAVPGAKHLPLRRPISVMDADFDLKTVSFGIRPQGEGTRLICESAVGSDLDIIMPLGRGYRPGDSKRIWLVGGGVGVAPLCLCAKRFCADAEVKAFLGFRAAENVYGVSAFQRDCASVRVCTDDGSSGKKGVVTDLFAGECLPDVVMACGSAPMLRAVKEFCLRNGVPCQLSLEERMGCGYGACLTCSCRAAEGGYKRVCADGPVFDSAEVEL